MTTTQIKPVFSDAKGNGAAVAGKRQIKAGSGVVRSLRVYNGTGADVFVQVFDSLTEPANTDVPDILIGKLPDATAYESTTPISCTRGCWVMISDTAHTLTLNSGNVAISAEIQ